MTDSAEIQVEDVLFNVLKVRRQEALTAIGTSAETWGVRIEGIQERPKRLSVDIRVQVTGKRENIAAFCKETGGRGSQDPPHTIRRWVGGIIEGIPW